jgi:predicted ATPase
MDHITRVDFHNFKAFTRFTLHVREFNILVGPNNAGKSTILAAFRILAAGIRKANARVPVLIKGPRGLVYGYHIDLKAISVAEENIFHNYDDSEPAIVKFSQSNGNHLLLFFPEKGACGLIPQSEKKAIRSTVNFKAEFQCQIGFVPILGPVDHHESLYKLETAKDSLYNYTAARNFRNIWHHIPNKFDIFRAMLQKTWPGMDIERPTLVHEGDDPKLYMFCPEGRIPREIFWAGFGFQVWCQMLTHITHAQESSLFLIDEPDIYIHADLQRQLLTILRELGPDIVIATHSTEIICDADPDEIVLIDKKRQSGKLITVLTAVSVSREVERRLLPSHKHATILA